MTALPHITPSYAPQPPGVPWPSDAWPTGDAARPGALSAAVERAFTDPELAETQAVVVVQGGRVVAERYGGTVPFFDRPPEPVTASTALLSWSMAKSMLHFVVGTLVDDGLLDPDDEALVPEWDVGDDPRHVIRLADLLSMRDGLGFIESYDLNGHSDVVEMLFGSGQGDVAGFATSFALAHPPGTHFNYSSATSNIISRIVADQVGPGEPYRDYLNERLFAPLGMSSARATFDDTGTWVASTFVHATALDFARFGLLYLRGGEWDGRRLVSQAWADTAQWPLSVEDDTDEVYSWHWWVTGDEHGTYWASGYEGQMICVAPALDAVVVRLGRSPEENAPARAQWRCDLLNSLGDPNVG
ncbi:MAG: serine hydrolase domain-containing protein [Acidimicrobiales bacterium]